MRAPRVCRWLLAAAFVLAPLSATATPVVYNFTSGTLTATALVLPSTVVTFNGSPSLSIPLTGTSFTLDVLLVPTLLIDNAIVGFSFVTLPTALMAVTGLGPVTSVSFGAITVTGGVGFTSSVDPSPMNFTAGPIAASGTLTTNFGGPAPFSGSTASATGQINLETNTITVNEITIGVITTSFGTVFVKGDFVFHGVPEPGTAALLAIGALALTGASKRRSS